MEFTTMEVPPSVLFVQEAEIEFFEPKRVIVSPLDLCLLSNPDDLFEDD